MRSIINFIYLCALYIVADHTLQYNTMKCEYKINITHQKYIRNIKNINVIGVYL